MELAMPLVVSTSFMSLTLFVDRMFLAWKSPEVMAAAMPAGMLHWTMTCLPFGIAMYVNTFVAQYYGAGEHKRIGAIMSEGVRVSGYTVPLCMCLIPAAPLIFRWAGHDAEMAVHEILYFQVLAFGAGASIMCGTLSSFFTGRSDSKTVMFVNVTAALVNVALDYLLIFGIGVFPELGIEGAAWATVAAHWSKVFMYVVIMRKNRQWFTEFDLRLIRAPNFELLKRLFRFGGPNGFQFLVEGAGFTMLCMFIGQLGYTATAATTLAFNVNSIAFFPIFGVGVAVSTLVGQQQGKQQPDLAARATWTGLWIAIAYTTIFVIAYLFVPRVFLMLHHSGMENAEFERISDITVVLLRFVAAFCLLDAIQMIFVHAIKGAGDTRFVLVASIVISVGMVSIAKYLSTIYETSVYWWWAVITIWIAVLAITYAVRFAQGRWRTMQVIEPELIDTNS